MPVPSQTIQIAHQQRQGGNRKGLKDMTCECYGVVRAQLTAALPEIGMN